MIRAHRGALAIAASAWLMLVGCSSDAPREASARSTSAALRGGTADAQDANVVALLHGDEFLCSGVVVGPRAVLTAAHCFAGDLGGRRVVDRVRIGAPIASAGGSVVGVAAATVHPGFHQADDGTLAHDLAVVMLSEPTTAPAAELLPAGSKLDANSTLRIVGFGTTGELVLSEDGEVVGGAGTKRFGDAKVTAVEPEIARIAPGPALICSGDSGGPAFTTVGGRTFVAGIASWGDAACEEYGVEIRVDAHRDFIDAAVRQANEGKLASAGKATGTTCDADGECESLSCAADQNDLNYQCRASCTPDVGCGGAGECRPTGRNAVPYACFTTPLGASPAPTEGSPDATQGSQPAAAAPPPPADAASCAVAHGAPAAPLGWSALLMLGAAIVRRRARAARGMNARFAPRIALAFVDAHRTPDNA